MFSKRCIMGCPRNKRNSYHRFPKDPKRRAEWCRILGVNPKTRKVTICSAHFSNFYVFGKKLSKFAMPNPPGPKKIKLRVLKPNSSAEEHTLEISNTEATATTNDLIAKATIQSSLMDNDDVVTESATESNTEDFEIRQQDTNEVILQFRCIETKNSVMLSFITPQKYALQQKIKHFDEVCSQQLKEIQELTKTNARLREKWKCYRLAMLQWRHVKPINRYLNFKLKKFRQKMTSLQRRLEIIERTKTNWDEFWAGLNC